MNAPLPLNLMPLNMQTLQPETDILATLRGGDMPLHLMVQHAEQLQSIRLLRSCGEHSLIAGPGRIETPGLVIRRGGLQHVCELMRG